MMASFPSGTAAFLKLSRYVDPLVVPPVIHAIGKPNEALNINWTSKLPATHLLPIDHSIHGAESSLPAVRNVAHLHGRLCCPR
jgi:hypothetical protein